MTSSRRTRAGSLTLVLVAGAVGLVVVGCQSTAMTSAKVYIQQQDWEDALGQLEVAVAETPADPEAWRLLGVARAELGQYAAAGAAFDQAVAIDSSTVEETQQWRRKYWVERFNMGIEAVNAGDDATAATRLTEAAGLDPHSADTQRSLGYAHYSLEDNDAALAAYGRALAIEPDDETAVRIGYIHFNEGRFAEAVEYLAGPAQGTDDAQLLNILAVSYQNLGREDEALQALQNARAANPDDVDVLLEVGRIFWDREDYGAAADIYRDAVAAAPDSPDPHHNLAMAILEQARIAEEGADTDTAAELAADARGHLERVVELNPEAGDAWYWLGVLYARANQAQDSERAFQKASDLGVE